jgi:carboxylate-amine ligase
MALIGAQETLEENRFIAARDGMDAKLIDPVAGARVPAMDQLEQLLEACAPHARDLGCETELAPVMTMAECTGAKRQLATSRNGGRLPGLVETLADRFLVDYQPSGDDSDEPEAALAS